MELSLLLKIIRLLTRFLLHHGLDLKNFRIIMEDSFFWEAVRNTLAISLMKLFLGFAIPIILAVMIFEMRDGHLKK